jgi:hypothetical protein
MWDAQNHADKCADATLLLVLLLLLLLQHNVYEYWIHPAKFRIQMCQDGNHCCRPLCFFAHNLQVRRTACHTLHRTLYRKLYVVHTSDYA